MNKVLVSACLLGEPVRYDGQSKPVIHPVLQQWQAQGRLISCCPEVSGGLPVPRIPAEIQGERVINAAGEDVSRAFSRGAGAALGLCIAHDVHIAVLKEGSPSCGSNRIYDGSFQGVLCAGEGMTCRLLRAYGVQVFSEHELEQAAGYDASLQYRAG